MNPVNPEAGSVIVSKAPRARQVIRYAGAALFVAVAAWPWDVVRSSFSSAVSSTLDPLLSETTFGGLVSISLAPLDDPPHSEETQAPRTEPQASGYNVATHNLVADSALTIGLAKYEGTVQLQLSLRRDVYLPLVLLTGLVLGSALTWKRKLGTLAVGYVVIGLVAVASIYLWLANIFCGRFLLAEPLSKVYPVSKLWGDVLEFLLRGWLFPPGNRAIAPILLGAFLIGAQWLRIAPKQSKS